MNPSGIGLFGQFTEWNALIADEDTIVAERDEILRQVKRLAGKAHQPSLYFAGGQMKGHAVHVGRGVRDVNAIEPDAEFLRGDLRHFLKQALPHFRAAVIEVDGAILINMHQGASLIEVLEREGNSELHRRE